MYYHTTIRHSFVRHQSKEPTSSSRICQRYLSANYTWTFLRAVCPPVLWAAIAPGTASSGVSTSTSRSRWREEKNTQRFGRESDVNSVCCTVQAATAVPRCTRPLLRTRGVIDIVAVVVVVVAVVRAADFTVEFRMASLSSSSSYSLHYYRRHSVQDKRQIPQ